MQVKEESVLELCDGKQYVVTGIYNDPLGYECELLEVMQRGYITEDDDLSAISRAVPPEEIVRVIE